MSPLIYTLAAGAAEAAKKSHEPSGMSTLGGVIALIVMGIGAIAVGGAAIMMMVGAINSRRQLVTSWSVEQEATFSSYEQKSQAAQSKAWMTALISSAAFTILTIGIYFGVKPNLRDQEAAAKSMNMSNLTKKAEDTAPAKAAPAKTDTPAVAPAEKKEAPKEEEKSDDTEDKEEKTEEKK